MATIYDQLSYDQQMAEHILIAKRLCTKYGNRGMHLHTLAKLTNIREATLKNFLHRPSKCQSLSIVQLERVAIALGRTFSELKPNPPWEIKCPLRVDNIDFFRSEDYESLSWLEQLKQNIRIARKRQDMTIEGLNRGSNITYRQWYSIVEGERDITCYELDLIAKALGTDFYQLKPSFKEESDRAESNKVQICG